MQPVRLPVVVIVGRPNVGKSTLFNRMAGRRIAVVEDSPGITRDRLYAECTHYNHRFLLVDTGGILFGDDDPLVEQIRLQAEVALAEADLVLFLVDCVEGVTLGDQDLAHRLRHIKSPVLVLANKADNKKRASMATEFYELGFEHVIPLSGLNGSGVGDVIDLVLEHIPKVTPDQQVQEELKLAIVGRPNVGKSSLLNAFTGEQRSIVSNIPGTTRDAIDTLVEYRDQQIRLVDTAGIRRKGKIQGTVEYYMALRAMRSIERGDCAIVVIDGHEGLTDQDKRVAKASHDEGKSLVFVVNKWDLIEPPDGKPRVTSVEKKNMIKRIRNEAPELDYAPIVFTSAQEASGLEGVLDAALMSIENWAFRISTGQLNRLIHEAMDRRPYTSKGRILRVYYSTQASTKPPTFILFCNDPDLMHFSYKRYLENQLRKQFPLPGTPVRLITRSSRKEHED